MGQGGLCRERIRGSALCSEEMRIYYYKITNPKLDCMVLGGGFAIDKSRRLNGIGFYL